MTTASPENIKKMKSRKTIFVVISVLGFVLGSTLSGIVFFDKFQSAPLPLTQVENLFLDVNQDGKLDLLVSGNVIFNGEVPLNFQEGAK